jgi:transcriptional regulator with XRE-family HTH domain
MSAPISTAARILGERVRARRRALGISQETLADRSGLHWTFVGQVERGKRNLSLHNLLKLAVGLGMDAGDLLQGLGLPQAAESGIEREREMYDLRANEGLTLRQLAERYRIGPERVRQLLNHYASQATDRSVSGAVTSKTATVVRRAKDLAQAQTRAPELLAAWRDGRTPEEIAKTFGLRYRSVAQVIRKEATAADRATCAYARALARAESEPGSKSPTSL